MYKRICTLYNCDIFSLQELNRIFSQLHKVGNVGIKGLYGGQQKNSAKNVNSSEDRTGDLCRSSLIVVDL